MNPKGPHPLPLHIGMAMSQQGHYPSATFNIPDALSPQELAEIIRGIKLYQDHPCKPDRPRLKTVWKKGATRLLRVSRKDCKKKSTLVLVPSLINKSDIFNLSKERSIMLWLEAQDIACYLLDWGDLVNNNEQDIDIEYLVSEKLVSALRKVSKIKEGPVDCLGYCMGGTLLMAAQNSVSDIVRRTILLATPWNFHAPEMRLTDHVGLWMPASRAMVEERGYLPASWLQGLFATLEPEGSARKFIRFASMDQASDAAQLFVLIEDWLNNGVDLPMNLAHHCIQEWFIRNAPYKGSWRIGCEMIDLKNISAKMLIVASQCDRLVPLSSAVALKTQLKKSRVDILDPNCGHIGFVAGKNSMRDVWGPILNWLQEDDFAGAV